MTQRNPNVRPKRAANNRQSSKKKIKSKTEKNFDLFLGAAGIGMVVGVMLTVAFYADALTSVSTVFSMIAGFGLVVILVALPIGLKKDEKGKTHLQNVGIPFYVGICILGGGSLLTGLTFTLNSVGKSAESIVEIYQLGEQDKMYKASTYSGIVYHLKDDAYEDQVDLRWFKISDNYHIKQLGYIQYEMYEGLFGIKIIKSRGAVSDSLGSDYRVAEFLGDGY